MKMLNSELKYNRGNMGGLLSAFKTKEATAVVLEFESALFF